MLDRKRTDRISPAMCGWYTPVGMHARPAVKLTKLAKKFQAQISVRVADAAEWINAKSVAKIMAMRAARGSTIEIKASGSDAEAAVAALVDLIATDFPDGAHSMQGAAQDWPTAAGPPRSALPMVRSSVSMPARTARASRARLARRALALRAAIDAASGQIADLADDRRGRSRPNSRIPSRAAGGRGFHRSDLRGRSATAMPADVAWRRRSTSRSRTTTRRRDEYLKARSSDLADLRDRVMRILRGGEGQALKIPQRRRGLRRRSAALAVPGDRLVAAAAAWRSCAAVPTSHVAMLARARGIPMVVQLGAIADIGRTALLDGEGATLELDPSAEQIRLFETRRESHRKSRASARAILRRPTASWRGERIRLLINIQRVDDLEHADAQYADGIGLMRTEFLFDGRGGLPDEETQFQAYDAVLRWADRRPVTIRTFDAGGDKPVAGFTPDGEANPFLGVRGLRLCLARARHLCVQLRALARAAVRGNLKVMFPMVDHRRRSSRRHGSCLRSRAALAGRRHCRDASRSGNHGRGPGGGPGDRELQGRLLLDRLERSRAICPCLRSLDNGALATLIDPLHPAVLELIARIAGTGGAPASGQPVRRHGGRSALRSGLAALRLARAFGQCLRARRRSSRRSTG